MKGKKPSKCSAIEVPIAGVLESDADVTKRRKTSPLSVAFQEVELECHDLPDFADKPAGSFLSLAQAPKLASANASIFSAISKGLKEFRNPNTFQFCLTHIKHALKGVTLVRFQENKTNAKFDEDYAGKYLTSAACTMSDLHNSKRIARRCFQHEKDEKIRWTSDPGVFALSSQTPQTKL